MACKDAIGQAMLDYQNGVIGEQLIVKSSISEDDEIPIDYLFRTENELPKLEKKALDLCIGKVLDVGAASGVHSLILKEKGFEVKSIDVSEGAIEVMKLRGLLNVELQDFYSIKNQKFDTILMLMNGSGLAGTIEGLTTLLNQAKTLLNNGGQILMDSSDISYMFEDEDGSVWIDLNSSYHGEVQYQMVYKDCISDEFDWLFVDFDRLKLISENLGWKCEKIQDGEHFDYLSKLTLI